MPTQRQTKVKQAIESIRAFYKAGKESLRARPEYGEYGKNAIKEEAEKLGINEDTLRKARQFADPVSGWSPEDVETLCKLIRTLQVGQPEGNAIFSKTHIVRLTSVKDKNRRMKLQEKAIKECWSTSRLDAELAMKLGTRRSGGRRRQIFRDKLGFLAQLESMCEEWRRWRAEVDRNQAEYPWDKLPEELRGQIEEAVACLATLHATVDQELHMLQPNRESRQALQEVSEDDG